MSAMLQMGGNEGKAALPASQMVDGAGHCLAKGSGLQQSRKWDSGNWLMM